ncbi:MAG: hypothetical protein GXO62_05110 [Epsilonproteobacteria bacterium]|nr:hypothetical protein [Campylobacterota bacterium]
MRYDVIEKIGEGKRGEVYKVKLQNGEYAALKWAKNYNIDKEWKILNHLQGRVAPKPLFRGKKFFVMELIEGVSLKNLSGKDYYLLLKEALKGAYILDTLGVFHRQLGRYYHIVKHKNGVRFFDFERAVLRDDARNFTQIIGFYLREDSNFDKNITQDIAKMYKHSKKEALYRVCAEIDKVIKGLK